jgi:hypothetical protein
MRVCWVKNIVNPKITKIFGRTPRRGGIPPSDNTPKKKLAKNILLDIKLARLLAKNSLVTQNV